MYSTSVSGMSAADLLLAATADNISNMTSDDYSRWRVSMSAQKPEGVTATASKLDDDGLELADEMVGLITGSVMYKANARAFKIGADAEQSLFDAVA